MKTLLDILAYFAVVGTSTYFCVLHSLVFLPVTFVSFTFRSSQMDKQLVEKKWLNWFEVVKLATALLGVLALVTMQLFPHTYSYLTLECLLVINMFEAVVAEVIDDGVYAVGNSLTGCILILMSFAPDDSIAIARTRTASLNTVHFPLRLSWIFLYCCWNAAFSYGRNFSSSTRWCLAVSILAALLMGEDLWLAARTYSLVFNMLFRSTQVLWIFVPGKSTLTKAPGDPVNSKRVAHFAGYFNLLFCIAWIAPHVLPSFVKTT